MRKPDDFLRIRILKQLRTEQPEPVGMIELGLTLGMKKSKIDKVVWLQLKLLRADDLVARTGSPRYYRYAITHNGIAHLSDVEAGKHPGHNFAAGAKKRDATRRHDGARRAAAKSAHFRAWADSRAALSDEELSMAPYDDRHIIWSQARQGQAPARPIASVFHLGMYRNEQ
ncbi:MAG: hypothetical protein KF796_20590 [Ramlibacter sp.]|nr:hypothetical protein [Ramlibacter sp.]